MGTSGTCQIPVNATSLFYQNLLKPVDENMNVPNSECDYSCYSNYVLANGKFNRVDDETPISAYQAYLQVTTNVALDTETISLEFVDMALLNLRFFF